MSKECPSCHRDCPDVWQCVDCGRMFCIWCGRWLPVVIAPPKCPDCTGLFQGRGEKVSRDDDEEREVDESNSSDDSSSDYSDYSSSPDGGGGSSGWGEGILAFAVLAFLIVINPKGDFYHPSGSVPAQNVQQRPAPPFEPPACDPQSPSVVAPHVEMPILSASTEGAIEGFEPSTPPVAIAVMGSLDPSERSYLSQCMAQNNVADESSLFVMAPLPPMDAEQLYFVRSDNDKPCPMIGAHVFRYWLVAESNGAEGLSATVRYRGGGDQVSVLRTITNGSYDIESSYCAATGCDSSRMQYNGQTYVPTDCNRRCRTNTGQEIVLRTVCENG